MKTTVSFKSLDLVLQVACFAIPAMLYNVLVGWCAFGGAQLLSTLLNKFFLPKELRAVSRIGYEVFAIIFCICGGLALVLDHHSPNDLFTGFVVTSCAASPILAIWYIGITVIEINKTAQNDEYENDAIS